MQMKTVAFLAILSLCCFSVEGSSLQKKQLSKYEMAESISQYLVSDFGRDITKDMFCYETLRYMEPDFLVRLYEAEMRGFNVLPGRMEDIYKALMGKIREMNREEVIMTLFFAYTNKFDLAFEALVSELSDQIEELFESFECLQGFNSEGFIEKMKNLNFELIVSKYEKETELKADEDKFDDYEEINMSDGNHIAYEHVKYVMTLDLPPKYRLPALVRKVLKLEGSSLADNKVDSEFLKKNVLNTANIRTALALYEVEMMDNRHENDTSGVIESFLKKSFFFNSNEKMTVLAYEMYKNEFFSALKLIIDTKFSYESPFKNPIYFLDLSGLFHFARQQNLPLGFHEKVFELASPDAIRRYNKMYKTEKDKDEEEFVQFFKDFDDYDEDMEEIVFTREVNLTK